MSRFSNFVLYTAVASIIYVALLFELLPTPGLSSEVKGQILPVVSRRARGER